jgi:heme a synthase
MRSLDRYSWLALFYILGVILFGAVVRATGSGAGCGGHWPLCNGDVVPSSPTLATLIEYTHRATSGLALIVVLGLVAMAFSQRPKGDLTRLGAVLALVFVLTEAAVGAGLVRFELVADNRSMARALVMATHLVNTFLLLGALALTAHWAGGRAKPAAAGARGALLAGLAGMLLVGMSGAVAALGDTLFPAGSVRDALGQDFSTTSHMLVRLRVLHPLIAMAVGLGLILMAPGVPKRFRGPGVARFARLVAILVFVEVLAGILNIVLLAPVWMQVVHLLIADLLWIALVLLLASALWPHESPPSSVAAAARAA